MPEASELAQGIYSTVVDGVSHQLVSLVQEYHWVNDPLLPKRPLLPPLQKLQSITSVCTMRCGLTSIEVPAVTLSNILVGAKICPVCECAVLKDCPTCGPLQGFYGDDVGTVNLDCPVHGEHTPTAIRHGQVPS